MLARGAPAGPVRRWFGPDFAPVAAAPAPSPSQPTSSWAACSTGPMPRSSRVPRPNGPRRAAGLDGGGHCRLPGPVLRSGAPRPRACARRSTADPRRWARLVTVGLIDPAPRALGGVRHPVRRPALGGAGGRPRRGGRADPRLARWADARLVPKVVLATQTRVLEPLVDLDGRLVAVGADHRRHAAFGRTRRAVGHRRGARRARGQRLGAGPLPGHGPVARRPQVVGHPGARAPPARRRGGLGRRGAPGGPRPGTRRCRRRRRLARRPGRPGWGHDRRPTGRAAPSRSGGSGGWQPGGSVST